MSPIAEQILERLDATRQRWWLSTLLSTAVLGFCVSLAVILAFLLADSLWKLSQPVLVVLFVSWLSISMALVVGLFRRLARGQRSLEATARRVEAQLPELGSNLINVVQFAGDTHQSGMAFREAALRQAADVVGPVPFDRAASRVSRWQRFRLCMQTPRDVAESSFLLAGLVGLAVVCYLLIPTWGSAAGRLMTPWKFVPQVGQVEIVEVTPGDTDVLIGTGLEITATIRNPRGKTFSAYGVIGVEESQQTRVTMLADETGTKYRLVVPTVTKPLTYRLEIGDSQTRVYRVGVGRKPTIAELEIVYHFPDYLGRPEETVRQKQADLEGPQYTVAELRIRPSSPVAKGYVESRGMSFPGRVSEEGELLTIARLPMVKTGTFTVHMENAAGHCDANPRANRLRVVDDQPPAVALLKPLRQSTAAPGERVAVMLRATDDHGLGMARLELRVEKKEGSGSFAASSGAIERIHAWSDLSGQQEAVLRHELFLDPARFKAGQTVLVRAVAADRRAIGHSEWGQELRPQQVETVWHAIRLIDTERRASDELAQLDSLRAVIYKILLDQIRTRIDAAKVPKLKRPQQASLLADSVRTKQVRIQKASEALAKSIDTTERPAERTTKRVLGTLTTGVMVEAVRRADSLVRVKNPAAFAEPAERLGETQQAIISTLRGLLDVARRPAG